MKKFIKNLSVVSLVAISAFALTSCASTGGSCSSDCSKPSYSVSK